LETLKDIATKSDETHIRDSCNIMQIFKPIAARYLSPVRAKIYIFFLTGDSPGWLPSHTIHFSKAHIKLILSCNWHVMLLRLTIVEKFALLEGQNFGFWGSPKREKTCGTNMYHHAKFHADQCHRRRDMCPLTQKSHSTQYIWQNTS